MSAGSTPLYQPARRLSAEAARGFVLIAVLLVLLALGAAVLGATAASAPAEGEMLAPFRWTSDISLA